MKVSFITTVFNEEHTIDNFLNSLLAQTKLPDEIIIVDGGSTDDTFSIISNFQFPISSKKVKIIQKKGNRSVGRNLAIQKATGSIIACSDAGNILDKNWLKKITQPFGDKKIDVVAGYYAAKPKNVFQKCLLPYVFVMPDQVNPEHFLPATRSVAFTKAIWKKIGGFDERLSHNEDYAFAKRLEAAHAKMVFVKDAIVYWIPRDNFKQAFIMFFRFALGDVEAGIWRAKVLLLLARYFIGLYLIFLCLLYRSVLGAVVVGMLFVGYIVWSITKNYRYVKLPLANFYLPLLQFTSDVAVILGTIFGIVKRVIQYKYLTFIGQNKFLLLIVAIYVGYLLLTLRWGIPDSSRPFPYHMDEWHQFHAVVTTITDGTPNTEGSANGTMFHFLLSAFFLAPFVIFNVVDPTAFTITDWEMRERLFTLLRLNTLLWGVGTLMLLYATVHALHASKKIAVLFFATTPVWLMLSGYFKYDIALSFWILLSLFFFIRFAKKPSRHNFLIAAIPQVLAISVKVSAAPLLILYVMVYLLFYPSWRKNIKTFLFGFGFLLLGITLFGFPDTLFGRGNILYYLYDNIIHSPNLTQNFSLGVNPYIYLFTQHYPLLFGHGFIFLLIVSLIYLLHLFFKEGITKHKITAFLFAGMIVFLLSLLPLQLSAVGNRSLVLLPFFVLLIAMALKRLLQTKRKNIILFMLCIVGLIQVYEVFSWVSIKSARSVQEISSDWIRSNIPDGAVIGVENIPIYQMLPDLIQQEFYYSQYDVRNNNVYRYKLVASTSKELPVYVVITNDVMEERLVKKSPKNDLVHRLEKEKYKKIADFSPNFTYYEVFGTREDFYLSGLLVASPERISLYHKVSQTTEK
ncbi:MAG: glycosyltransferase [Patescibacteria group bacterium]